MINVNLQTPSVIVDTGIEIVENDSGQLLEFTIAEGEAVKDLTDCTVTIRFRSMNGYVTDEPAEIVEATSGRISYSLLGTEFSAGKVLGIVSVHDSVENRQSTCRFTIECVDGINSDSSVRASRYYSELEKLKANNTISNIKLEGGRLIITYANGDTFDAGDVAATNLEENVLTCDALGELETNRVYSMSTSAAQVVDVPIPSQGEQNQIMVYLNVEEEVEIVWDENIVFVDGVVPDVGVGCHRIIFEYNPILAKWVVGVLHDGVVN